MAVAVIRVQVHGHEVEVGCYGTDSDWVCRLTDPSCQFEGGDAYSPPPDLGFVWFRESGGMLLASGMVNRVVFRDADSFHLLLYRVSEGMFHRIDQLASCIEFVGVEFTETFDGEQGPVQHSGPWQEFRWWQPPKQSHAEPGTAPDGAA